MALNGLCKQLGIVIILLTLFSIAGCAGGPTYETVDVKDVVVKTNKIPMDLLEQTIPSKPITKEEYLKLKPHELSLIHI